MKVGGRGSLKERPVARKQETGFGDGDRRSQDGRREEQRDARRDGRRDGPAPDAGSRPQLPNVEPKKARKAVKKPAAPKVRAVTPTRVMEAVSLPETSALAPRPGEEAAKRLLVIEDNPKMAAAIAGAMRKEGYHVDVVHVGFDGEEAILAGGYDLVILDLMLPDRDGLDVCRAVRGRRSRVPILILSAISATCDKVAGLEAGADDYMAKPFEFEELLARVRALLRRPPGLPEQERLRVADLELNVKRRFCTRGGGQAMPLTTKECALLEYFMRNVGRVLTRTQIGEQVWDLNYDPSSNVIEVYVSMLRRKIDRGHGTPLLHMVVGRGYMMSEAAPVQEPAFRRS